MRAPQTDSPQNLADPSRTQLSWVIRLRWGGCVSQLALAFSVARWGMMPPPWAWMLSIIGVGIGTNCALWWWHRQCRTVKPRLIFGALVLDVALLTLLLLGTGGAMNPFTFLYLAQVALASVVLPGVQAFVLGTFAVLSYAALFVTFENVPDFLPAFLFFAHEHAAHQMDLHLRGMWVAFALTTLLLVLVIERLQRDLAQRARLSRELQELSMNNERLASLATLAGGAAHEFSTPLGTIALAASEMKESMERQGASFTWVEDANLILEEVARCRDILQHLAADAGQSFGEAPSQFSLVNVLEEAAEGIKFPMTTCWQETEADTANAGVRGPRRALATALRGILKNALEASGGDAQKVKVGIVPEADAWCLCIRDEGTGMAPAVLARAGEPFFTTKAPDAGMGVGLYLAKTLVRRLQGELVIESEVGRGTTVKIILPRDEESVHVG